VSTSVARGLTNPVCGQSRSDRYQERYCATTPVSGPRTDAGGQGMNGRFSSWRPAAAHESSLWLMSAQGLHTAGGGGSGSLALRRPRGPERPHVSRLRRSHGHEKGSPASRRPPENARAASFNLGAVL
jgi:hypothetical protein